jgi:hypothetical protein
MIELMMNIRNVGGNHPLYTQNLSRPLASVLPVVISLLQQAQGNAFVLPTPGDSVAR